MRSVPKSIDLVKLSDTEAPLLTGEDSPWDALRYLNAAGVGCAVVTLGKVGAVVGTSGEYIYIPAIPNVHAVDTTRAGDAFWAAFLSRVVEDGAQIPNVQKAAEYARYANAAAAACVSANGAIPALPTKQTINKLLERTAQTA